MERKPEFFAGKGIKIGIIGCAMRVTPLPHPGVRGCRPARHRDSILIQSAKGDHNKLNAHLIRNIPAHSRR